MKKIHLILFLIPLISYCQTDNEYKLQKTSHSDWDQFCISKIDCFNLNYDAVSFDYCMLYFSHGSEKKQMVDTVFSQMLYGSTLNSFKSTKDNSYIVLWKIEMEFVPLFYAYYINDGKLIKIGEWTIYVPCDTCDAGDYKVENIRIHQKDKEIEFSFLKDTRFFVNKENFKYDDWGTFKAGELKVSFNIVDETVKRVIERE
jgi:hypothetical protein